MSSNHPGKKDSDLYKAILELKDLDECRNFFEDLCAATELQAMEQRFEVARMLKEGKVYLEIMQETNSSSATISRVNRMMNGGTGCIPEILDRIASGEENK